MLQAITEPHHILLSSLKNNSKYNETSKKAMFALSKMQ